MPIIISLLDYYYNYGVSLCQENLDKLNERIYNRNYKRGILAARDTKGLIEHEMAHFKSFQECKTYEDFVRRERDLRSEYIYGVSAYSDSLEDGAETIAEAFSSTENNDLVLEVKRLLKRKWGM